MRHVLRCLLLVSLLCNVAPAQAKKAPDEATGAAKEGKAQPGSGIVQPYRPAPRLSKPATNVIPGAAVYFDRANGLIRKVTSPGLALKAKTPQEAAAAFLKANHKALGLAPDLSDLVLLSTQSSPGGFHIRYQQVWVWPAKGSPGAGVRVETEKAPVWEARLAVHLDKGLRIQLLHSGVMPITKSPPTTLRLSAQGAIARAAGAMGMTGDLRAPPSASLVVYADRQPARLCWRVLLPAWKPLGDWEVLVDAASGHAVLARNLLRFVDGSGMVFDPNPVTTSGNYALTDVNDADYSTLNAERMSRVLAGLDGSGYLRGPHVTTEPTTGQANEPSAVYAYTRSDDRFEQVMTYYHIDDCQRYIQSLGFSNVNNRPQPVDVNGTTMDNSWYSPATGTITYGSGGVDDAEDADVIIHEYGHAIQDNQVPGFGMSLEGGAMGEGFSDYLAATRYAEDNWDWRVYIAEWDAVSYNPGAPAYLRRVDSTKHYPEDLEGQVHADGEIWSACLWQMREALGAATSDQIVIQSHFYLTPSSQFRDGADAILLADQNLNAGANQAIIEQIFTDRGIFLELEDEAYIALEHTWPSDLKVWLGVVGDPFPPLLVSDAQWTTQWLVPLTAYAAYLPPTGPNEWYVHVLDMAALDTGNITEFMINWGGVDYVSTDPPVAIPDLGGGSAHAYVEVSKAVIGTVTGLGSGTPLGGAQVSVFDTNGQWRGSDVTDGSGGYAVTQNLPEGAARVKCELDEYVTQNKWVTLTTGQSTVVDFQLEPVPESPIVTGTVTQWGGVTPLQGAVVSVFDDAGHWLNGDTTDVNGEYTIDTGLLGGLARVKCELDGYDTQNKWLTLTEGETTGVDFRVVPTGESPTVIGAVTEAGTGTPLEGAQVSVFDGDGQWLNKGATDASGDYLVDSNLTEGASRVKCELDGYLTQNKWATLAMGHSAVVDFQIVPIGASSIGSGSVDPTSGTTSTQFTWLVEYQNTSNISADAVYVATRRAGGSPAWHLMAELDPADTTTTDGKWYTYSSALAEGQYHYRFAARTGTEWAYWPQPAGAYQAGPTVAQSLMLLSSGYLTPTSGTHSTYFTWRVKYWNTDNTPPDDVWCAIWWGSQGKAFWYRMWAFDPSDTNYRDGKWYTLRARWLDSSAHAYRFAVRQGSNWAYWPQPTGSYAPGPTIGAP